MYVYLDLLSTTYDYIYSDSCTGQNRNRVMEMPLLHTVKTSSIEVIDHKFLQTGHTNMERLEFAKKKHTTIYHTSQWTLVVYARRKNPYTVVPLRHTVFLDFKTVEKATHMKTDSTGKRVNWI